MNFTCDVQPNYLFLLDVIIQNQGYQYPHPLNGRLHNDTTPICFIGINPTLAFQPLIDPV